jgi:Cytochrome P460
MSSFTKGMAAFIVAGVLSGASYSLASSNDGVDYPEGFRLFDHVGSMIVEPGFIFNGQDLGSQVPGLHHIYADKRAMAGYRELNAAGPGPVIFKDGSRIVFDLWQTQDVVSGGSAIVERARLAVAVMEKDSSRYGATGGWGFQVFDPATKTPLLDSRGQAGCFSCHTSAAGSDFVFSRLRD